jgi:hypothetical protein
MSLNWRCLPIAFSKKLTPVNKKINARNPYENYMSFRQNNLRGEKIGNADRDFPKTSAFRNII